MQEKVRIASNPAEAFGAIVLPENPESLVGRSSHAPPRHRFHLMFKIAQLPSSVKLTIAEVKVQSSVPEAPWCAGFFCLYCIDILPAAVVTFNVQQISSFSIK